MYNTWIKQSLGILFKLNNIGNFLIWFYIWFYSYSEVILSIRNILKYW